MNAKPLIGLAFTAVMTISAHAAVIHVPADQPTIQQAINAASNGDTILVSPGTYFERVDYRGKAVTIQGSGLPEETVIDGNNQGAVVTMQMQEGRQSVLTGVTIQHGNASGAGVMLLGTSPTIRGNVFRNNAQDGGGFGAAIGGNGSSPLIERNTFYSNTCDTQLLSGVISFVNTSSPLIYNNIIRNNPCRGVNMTVPVGSNPVVANNTIIGNSVGVRVDARVQTAAHLYANNIVLRNGVGFEVDFSTPNTTPRWFNNDVFLSTTNFSGITDQTGINGNISVDPLLFIDRYPRPPANSPVIDAGTLSVPNLPATDFDQRPRVVDGDGNSSALPDIGAYEFNPSPAPSTWRIVSVSLSRESGSYILLVDYTPSSNDSATVSYEWTTDLESWTLVTSELISDTIETGRVAVRFPPSTSVCFVRLRSTQTNP